MIVFEVDQEHYSNVMKVMDGVQKDSKAILKRAINRTAKQARRSVALQAKETYAVKISGFNKSMKIKNATVGRLEAVVSAKGEALELGQYKAQPFKVSNGTNRPFAIKAKVLTESSMRDLVKGNIKAFVTKFRSGKVAIVERDESKKMKSDPQKTFIKKLLSPSIPQMLGNEKKVFGKVEPEIETMLTNNIRNELQRVTGGRA